MESLYFTREQVESVAKGQARADELLVAKTREVMLETGEGDFAIAFARVAQLNTAPISCEAVEANEVMAAQARYARNCWRTVLISPKSGGDRIYATAGAAPSPAGATG
jgi:hypothetical protein